MPYSFRNKHKLSPPRQKPNVLDPKKGLVRENILIEHFKPNRRKLTHGFATIGMWKRLFRQPLPLTKNEKTTADNFFNFWGSVACLLLHFIILRRKKPPYIAITLPTSLKLVVPNYSVQTVPRPACRKRRLLGTHQWQSALLVVWLPVIHNWFKMECHLFPVLISIRLTA